MPARLSCFAGILLRRTHAALTPGQFGQLAQCLLTECLRVDQTITHEDPGAGIPDLSYQTLNGVQTAVEIKYTQNGEVDLKERDIQGLRFCLGAGGAARLITLDIALPPTLWVQRGETLIPDLHMRPAAHAGLNVDDESEALAKRLEELLRGVDVDLIPNAGQAYNTLPTIVREWAAVNWA